MIHSEPAVVEVVALTGRDGHEVLRLAAAAASTAEHRPVLAQNRGLSHGEASHWLRRELSRTAGRTTKPEPAE